MNTKTKKSKSKAKSTQRVEGEWNAGVKTKWHKDTGRVERKVLTTGIVSIPLDGIMPGIVRVMMQGKEVRFTNDGEDVIRLYPCLDRTMTKIKASAQAMGKFAESLSSIKFHLVRKDGKEVSDLRCDVVNAREERRRCNVTPDTVVKCPKCGTEFRVGKQLV